LTKDKSLRARKWRSGPPSAAPVTRQAEEDEVTTFEKVLLFALDVTRITCVSALLVILIYLAIGYPPPGGIPPK
jgi:hypothetical protein